MSVTTQDITFPALDNATLTGTLFKPVTSPQAALLINAGTGIPRRFYGRFATHAAKRSFVVFTFDYRGVGGSAPSSLRGYRARYRDWGQLEENLPAGIVQLCYDFTVMLLSKPSG